MINIIQHNLNFRSSLAYRATTTHIVLHHTECTGWTVEQLHEYHKNINRWAGVGYHFYVRKDGSIHACRPDGTVGAHCPGKNGCGIGIAFEGNFMNETMTEEQIAAGNLLISYLKSKYGNLTIGLHKDYYNTDCPGTNFPAHRFNGQAAINQGVTPGVNGSRQETQWLQILCNQLGIKDINGNAIVEDGLMGPNTRYAIQHLPLLGLPFTQPVPTRHVQNILGLPADGIFGAATYAAVRKWQMEHGLAADGMVGANTWLSFA